MDIFMVMMKIIITHPVTGEDVSSAVTATKERDAGKHSVS
jgi:hypothetical protein